jgi:Rieske Fe-S protein
MERRSFIKQSGQACAAVLVLGSISAINTSCSSAPLYRGTIENKMVKVPLASFAESTKVKIRLATESFDWLCIKRPDNTFYTLELKCTHQDQPLSASSEQLFCASHGSRFDMEGNVMQEPALHPLRRFKTELQNDIVVIYT